MVTILFRTIIIYSLLLCAMKMMGKRQIGELEISDLVTTLMLSELAVAPIADNNIPLLYAIMPIFILISAEIILTFIITKSHILKKILSAKPSYIINKGQLQQHELEKIRMSVDEFIGELRLKDISDMKDVDYAILESNGKMSVFQKTGDIEKGIAHPLVIDGHVSPQNLQLIGRNESWLLKRIYNHKCTLAETFLFTIDDAGNENFIRRGG